MSHFYRSIFANLHVFFIVIAFCSFVNRKITDLLTYFGGSMYERIKELCKNRGITLKELETAVGVGNRTIYRWDQNSPSIEKVCAVAEYFGVSVDYVVKGEKPSSSDRLLSYAEARLIDDFRKLDPSRQSLVSEYVSLLKGHEEYIKTDLLHPEEKIGG